MFPWKETTFQGILLLILHQSLLNILRASDPNNFMWSCIIWASSLPMKLQRKTRKRNGKRKMNMKYVHAVKTLPEGISWYFYSACAETVISVNDICVFFFFKSDFFITKVKFLKPPGAMLVFIFFFLYVPTVFPSPSFMTILRSRIEEILSDRLLTALAFITRLPFASK